MAFANRNGAKKQGGAKRSGRWLATMKGQIVIDLEIWPDRTPFEHFNHQVSSGSPIQTGMASFG